MDKYFFKLKYHLGLGDFYTSACEIYYIAKKLKNENNSLFLFLYIKPEIDFYNIFEKNFYNIFDNIIINDSIDIDTNFASYNCLFELESWGLFGSNKINISDIKYFNLARPNLLNFTKKDYTLKLSDYIITETKKYLQNNKLNNFCVIHFRCRDDQADVFNFIDSEKLPIKIIDLDGRKVDKDAVLTAETIDMLKNILLDYEKIFVCSNCIIIKNFLKNFSDRIIVLDENYTSTLRRNYADKQYFDLCILEFCIAAFARKIFLFTNYSWISNFLSYGILTHELYEKENPYEQNQIISIHGNFLKLM